MTIDLEKIVTIVPDVDARHVATFCERIVSGQRAQSVRCEPDLTAPENECFAAVSAQVAKHGGDQVIGWALWEFQGVYVEAELHSVWRSPAGDLIDISPRGTAFEQILFLPDPTRVDDGRTIDNVRMALVADNDVKRYLFLCGQHYNILNAGDRALQREVSLGRRELKALQDLQKEVNRLRHRLAKRYVLGRSG